jgi:TFIIF-interacting CTD phosphatase-like protein
MDDWHDREIEAVIGVDIDKRTYDSKPVIIIDGREYSWEEFGKEIEVHEGWKFTFKIS